MCGREHEAHSAQAAHAVPAHAAPTDAAPTDARDVHPAVPGPGGIARRAALRVLGLTGLAGAVGLAGGAGLRTATARAGDTETRTYSGQFSAVDPPDWYYLPVAVPPGVRELAVRYSYDRPTVPPGVRGNALDIGIFGPAGHELGNAAGFRGWSGGFRDTFTLSASAATPGYVPGPVDAGTWHVILGPYTVAPQGMNWTVEVRLTYGEPGAAFVPRPAPTTAPGRGRAWYRGDLHVHTVHSDGARTPQELLTAAVAAELDFVVSTEHNTATASGVWGAVLDELAITDLLVIDGEEITTRNGHMVAAGLAPGQWVDWRYRAEDGVLKRFIRQIHDAGGLAVAAHPYCPFPGCDWRFGYELVDGIEVWNGPWTLDDELAVRLWDGLLRDGQVLPAVGSSDAHREPQVVGLPQTVVLADELSRDAILAGVAAGRSYLAESAAVSLRLVAATSRRRVGPGGWLKAEPGEPVEVRAVVTGAPGTTIRLHTELGVVAVAVVPDSGTGEVQWQTTGGLARYVRAEVRRPAPTETTPDTMVALSNPAFLGRR